MTPNSLLPYLDCQPKRLSRYRFSLLLLTLISAVRPAGPPEADSLAVFSTRTGIIKDEAVVGKKRKGASIIGYFDSLADPEQFQLCFMDWTKAVALVPLAA